MNTSTPGSIRSAVRQAYGAVATATSTPGGCCGGTTCCGSAANTSSHLGYSDADPASLPEGADLGPGCGNPQAIAALKPRERVLDLGSGAERAIASALIEAVKPVPSHADGPGPACCDSTAQLTCCEPAGKTACCGEASTTSQASASACGCQPRPSPAR